MKYIINKHHVNLPDKALIDDLRKTAKKLKKRYVGVSEYEREGKFHPATIIRRFGSWNSAVEKAGLKPKKRWRIPTDELLNNLKKVWDSLGRQPKGYELQKPLSDYLYINYFRRFGSWNRALEVFAGKYGCKMPKRTEQNKSRYKHYRGGNYHTNIINKFINKSMRFDVMRRDKFKCCLCGASPATDPEVILHVDHIIPFSKGGRTEPGNLQTLCSDCNYGKAAKSIINPPAGGQVMQ